MLMPESTPEADLIMVATGTGIAPYRGFMRRLFTEKTPAAENFKVCIALLQPYFYTHPDIYTYLYIHRYMHTYIYI